MRSVKSNQDQPPPDAYMTSPAQIPEDPDLTMTSDEPSTESVLPPHIAARFYRPANNRRKTSAASSRRNSLSSQHSHHSNRSLHNGPQSAYIAQHLRRASIMETRKARLADRAAHAEKVRYRAQVAKTAPRFSNCEERVLAAAQAREKYLAQVTASCAEEVKRAKRVAEDMKERKAAEGRRMREELEDKFAEAEKRRVEYKRNIAKSRRFPSAIAETHPERRLEDQSTPYMDEETAAKIIRRNWRASERRRIVRGFRSSGLSVERAQNMSFEELSMLISKDEVLNSTTKMLTLCKLDHVDTTGISKDTLAVRKFLSAFLILSHPAQILIKSGEIEQDLAEQSGYLLGTFELLVSKLTLANVYGGLSPLFERLAQDFTTFMRILQRWKDQDRDEMIELIVAQFTELEGIWQKVKHQKEGGVADEYAEGIQNNKAMLFANLKRMIGKSDALKLIKKATAKVRRATMDGLASAASVSPQVNTESPSDATGDASLSTENDNSPSSSLKVQSPPASLDEVYTAATHPLWGNLASWLPDNRTLTHELAIKQNFTINPQHKRTTIYHDAIAAMREAFNNGQSSNEYVLPLVSEVRVQLLRLFLTPKSSLFQSIEGTLDLEMLVSNLNRGVPFDLEGFYSYLEFILPKLCQPARDAQMKICIDDKSGDIFDRGARLLGLIDLISLDNANYMLRVSAPHLLKEGPGYEERQFAKELDDGIITLQKTERWWNQARTRLLSASQPSDGTINFSKCYMEALTDLAIATSPLDANDLPETLDLDETRLNLIRTKVLQIVTTGAILTLAKNLLKRDTRTPWPEQATRIAAIVENKGYNSATNNIADLIHRTLEQAHPMPPATKTFFIKTVEKYLAQASSRSLSDAFLNTILRRFKTHVYTRLSASSSAERIRVQKEAADRLTDIGLFESRDVVGEIVGELERVAGVDLKAHRRWYDEIAERAAGAGNGNTFTTEG